ncbi:MAG TPA: methyl-accepting chemotaxis protein [Steroidobacteraceae bacterium]|nr:methyl-accepting chemotaxis protein [Steroidobacteraceae bacterium]
MNNTTDKLRGTRALPVFLWLGLLATLAAAALYWFSTQSTVSASAPGAGSQLAAMSQNLPLEAAAAARGVPGAIDQLGKDVDELDTARERAGSPGAAAAWKTLLEGGRTVAAGGDSVDAVTAGAREVHAQMPRLAADVANLVSSVGSARVDSYTRALERFEMTSERLQQDIDALASGVGDTPAIATRLAASTDDLDQFMHGLAGGETGLGLPRISGADAQEKLRAVMAQYDKIGAKIRAAVDASKAFVDVQGASRSMVDAARTLYPQLATGSAAAAPVGGSSLGRIALILALLGVLAAAAAVVIHHSSANARKLAEQQGKQNERNQEAILRLLDELSSLADGDLTVQATVTEDITGAIADSINYAIEALRELVATINDTSGQLDGAAKQTQALAAHLAKASGAQSKQIGSATESIGAMASSTEEVSGNAERASDVARHSVDIAHKGGDAVRRTIDGMNAIRETIQETSKRIKRLGESSQEIGNIVELINDIAEQTNILALNASIQASMAGEAGRGFAVVADEVQRLAERAANATKQIEVLVRTIQTDTNEAVVSMERSTTDVVGGALLAENAGAALEEIEQVSNQIASLVQNISASSRGQASAAGAMARNMQVLREISSQTADSTSATSNSIGKLAELSAQLRKSVSGFRLPAGLATNSTSTRLPKLTPEAPSPRPQSASRKLSAAGGA